MQMIERCFLARLITLQKVLGLLASVTFSQTLPASGGGGGGGGGGVNPLNAWFSAFDLGSKIFHPKCLGPVRGRGLMLNLLTLITFSFSDGAL